MILNAVEVEVLLELKRVDSKLSLMARKLETIAKIDLKAHEQLFHLKIQVKQSIIEAIKDHES